MKFMEDAIKQYLENTYTIIAQLHKSPKSVIELAYDKISRQVCVIKHLQNINCPYELLRDIRHKILPQVYYIYRDEAELIVIEEYINGRTFREILTYHNEVKFSDEVIQAILMQLCEGLAVLHSKNIIHHDITLSNILLTNDNIVKLIDFDITRTYKPGKDRDTTLWGTKGYVAPEQYIPMQSDCRSDIYSLGIVLRHLQPQSKLLQHIIEKATQIDPKNRYQTVNEIMYELQGKYSLLNNKYKVSLIEFETVLKQNFKLFEVSLPVQERDYPLIEEDFRYFVPVSRIDDFDYESAELARDVALKEFNKIMLDNIDEYIKDILENYKITQLKKYYIYQKKQSNYYWAINQQIEQIIKSIADNFQINLPEYLKQFNFVPDYTKFVGDMDKQNFHLWQLKHLEESNYVEEIKQEFFERTLGYTAMRFEVYAAVKHKVLINIEEEQQVVKKMDSTGEHQELVTVYNFDINNICCLFYDELLHSTYLIIQDNPYLQEDVESLITKIYIPELEEALSAKVKEIMDFCRMNFSVENK